MTRGEAIDWLRLDIDMRRYDPLTGEEEILNDDAKKVTEAEEIAIEALKEPGRRPGRWIHMSDEYEDSYVCSECGRTSSWRTDFCGGCGAEMEAEHETQ